MATDMSDATNVTDQAKRLHFAETLLHVSRTVAAMETLDDVLAALIDMTVLETHSDRGTLVPQRSCHRRAVLAGSCRASRRSRSVCSTMSASPAGSSPRTSRLIINDAYGDPRFNREVDEQTGYETRNLVCAPITTALGVVIGVAQVLNKQRGRLQPRRPRAGRSR